ncbi:nuclear transport factor 2 family protein [Costertonia aggregata]|uniref:Nuclear transport factor 2 family protein n=1 Tax=Costertonia aggregata TaxID=343403 RepID=A0A7H9AKL4_9FLAO|nr:nuclear transport factor 2 family protein [Costertonia aggregata]QLG43990.1 nuclear transport factor 2 family protein [Costertonia aggregata]
MKRIHFFVLVITMLLPILSNAQERSKQDRARSIVSAVNRKDAKMYVDNFSENVKVYMYGEDGSFVLKVDGIEALYNNRAEHLKNHPEVRNEIQHLAEIDNRLIMHDKVWLTPDRKEGSSVVEIFTFDEEGKIERVDVIQQKNLFSQEK